MKKTKRINILNIAFIFVLFCFSSCDNDESKKFIGSYQSISESEWAITLVLLKNGYAEIIHENWIVGEYNNRNITKTKCKWGAKGDFVILNCNDIVDTLVYNKTLSLEEIGEEGGAPGLLSKSNNYSILNNVYLWKLPHNF